MVCQLQKNVKNNKKVLAKSASPIRSIVDIFSTHSNKTPSIRLPAVSPSKCSKKKVKETQQELQTQVVQEWGDLLRHKTV